MTIKAEALFLCLAILSQMYVTSSLGLMDSDTMQFISEFFSLKSVSTVVIFTCSDTDRQKLLKFLTASTELWVYAPGDEQRNATLETIVPQNFYSLGAFLDYDCPAGAETLAMNSGREYLNGSHHWLVSSNTPQVPREVDNLRLRLDSEVIWTTKDNSSGTITMHDLYRIDHGWPVVSTVAGTWHMSTGMDYTLTDWKFNASRRGDLRGLNLSAALLMPKSGKGNYDGVPLTLMKQPTDAKEVYGYLQNLELRKLLKFSVTVLASGIYGYVREEDKYEGVVKMVGEGEVNMSLTTMIVSNQKRLDHMHYLPCPTWIFRLVAMFRHPPVSGGYYALLRTFSPILWTTVMVTWLLIAAFLRLLAWTQLRLSHDEHQHSDEGHSWSDVLVLIVGTLAEQGSALDSGWIAWRLAFFMMLVLTVLLNNYYGAGVVSALLTEAPYNIKTLRDLINSPLKFGAEENHYSNKLFELDANPVIKELVKKKMAGRHGEKPVYHAREEGIKKMLHEEFAFHVEAFTVYDLIDDTFPDEAKCSLTEVAVYSAMEQYIVVPLKSPLKEILACALLRLKEIGVLKHMETVLLPEKPTCQSKSEVASVGLANVVPAFLILSSGILLSFVLMILECRRCINL